MACGVYGVMLRILILAAALATSVATSAAQRPQEGGPSESSVRAYLEQRIVQRLGQEGLIAARRAPTSIMVDGIYGEFAEVWPRILIRGRSGWTLWSRGGVAPLPRGVGAELDRLLADRAFWREPGFSYEQRCTGGARVAVIRYRGRERVTRQDCGPAGLVGRLADIASSGRLPAPDPQLPPDTPDRSRFEPPAIIWELSQAAARAWNNGDLETYLASYAEDVQIVWPTGTEYNKAPLRDRAARALRDRNRRRMDIHATAVRPLGPGAAIQVSHIYYSGGGRGPGQSWVTSVWQQRTDGWKVVHEQPSAEITGHSR